MSKRRISKKQQARIKKIQEKRRDFHGLEQVGLLVAHYGKYADVEKNQHHFRCYFRQHLGQVVVGDRVVFCLDEHDQGIIVAVNPRETLLYRAGEKEDKKLLAANVDQMIIMVAVIPSLSFRLLDSYLVAAEHLHIRPVILFNKIDIDQQNLYSHLQNLYSKLGYTILATSTRIKMDMEPLTQLLQFYTSIFVGQSGVGKSSLIHLLLPEEKIIVGDLHESTGLGTHTTSTSRLYHLPQSGDIIDSPGIRDFTLWPLSPLELAQGFKEFKLYSENCKFRNCTHTHEPQCGILQALKEKRIATSRWDSYRSLLHANELP